MKFSGLYCQKQNSHRAFRQTLGILLDAVLDCFQRFVLLSIPQMPSLSSPAVFSWVLHCGVFLPPLPDSLIWEALSQCRQQKEGLSWPRPLVVFHIPRRRVSGSPALSQLLSACLCSASLLGTTCGAATELACSPAHVRFPEVQSGDTEARLMSSHLLHPGVR